MVEDELEPTTAAGLFLLVNFWVIQNVSSLNLSPLIAEASFEKMLPYPTLLWEPMRALKMALRFLGFI